MEPVTHALTSLALARAGQKHLPRLGTAMLVVAGVAPDLDYASYLGGASSFLRFDRTLLHSLPSSALLACAIAGTFWFFTRQRGEHLEKAGASPAARVRFGSAFAICAIGIAGHLLLDVVSGVGVQLFWPFRPRWFALDLLTELDPWVLILLIAGLLLPMLFRLVGEEIGERKRRGSGTRGAIVTLLLLIAYAGVRGYLHSNAVDLLESRDYHGRTPLAAGAFPASWSPFEWRGVVSTDNTMEDVDVSLTPGKEFDPGRSVTSYKPEASAALEAGQRTVTAQRFLKYARFPLASVVRVEDGVRIELRDARFPESDSSAANILARVDMRGNLRVVSEEIQFASRRR
ncbi:MAG: metal-dependent hydrolase [Candidatus Acidiferrales bacterium]